MIEDLEEKDKEFLFQGLVALEHISKDFPELVKTIYQGLPEIIENLKKVYTKRPELTPEWAKDMHIVTT